MTPTFEKDVLEGLSAKNKFLSSKYFYDDEGSRIFKEIMEMPEYYLSNCEHEILATQAADIFERLNFSQPFNIIELGAGDGSKTFELLAYLLSKEVNFTYIPIDISQEAMGMLTNKLKTALPTLKIAPQIGDYFEVLLNINKTNKHQSLILFLGSNIGNYGNKEAIALMQLFNNALKKGDKLLMGMDLQKNPQIILQAYSDVKGVTKRFNLNILKRINRELSANFNLNNFDFYCFYNPLSGELFSYIVSLTHQTVNLPSVNTSITFKKDELIWTEQSKKYTFNEITDMAQQSGFSVVHYFTDKKQYFTDSLLIKN